MINKIRDCKLIKLLIKNNWYARIRQYFPMPEPKYIDDRGKLEDAEIIHIDWPDGIKKPRFGIVQDYGPYPRWTKNRRFLESNGFEYEIYTIQAHDWIEKAKHLDIIVGFISSEVWDLQEMRDKYYFLEQFLGKRTYPSPDHVNLYENKKLEAYICQLYELPFACTHVSHNKEDAVDLIEKLKYPVVSKIIPASGSMGVERVNTVQEARKIAKQSFSTVGRTTHTNHFRQKNFIYLQNFIPNDGYDIRIIVVGNWVFGYYRRVLDGDFRASGMNLVEKRELPEEAIRIAFQANAVVKSPMLVVDMVHGLDNRFYIIEFSPICQMETPEQLHVNGIPGAYVLGEDNTIQFKPGKYWVHELALREFLLNDYLTKVGINMFGVTSVR